MKNEYSQVTCFKYFSLFAMLYITTLIATGVITSRIIQIGFLIEPGGILLFPITYFITDIIAEVYGYRVARQVIWYGIITQFVFVLMLKVSLMLPTHLNSLNQAFLTVEAPIFRFFMSITIASLISAFFNIYLISKWKVLVQGRYFWLRSLGSTTIGEFVFSLLALGLIFVGKVPGAQVLQLAFYAYLTKLIYGLVLIIPSSIIVAFLKKAENIDIYDTNIKFNPFSISVDR